MSDRRVPSARPRRAILVAVLLSAGSLSCATESGDPESGDTAEITFQNLFGSGMTPGVACYRIPALVTAPNGDLIAAIDERVPSCADLRGNRDINIVARRSSDGGATWSDIETIADFPEGRSASDPSMILDAETGEVLLFYNFMDLDLAPDVYHLHVMKSADNGRSWSEPVDITSQITPTEWENDFKFITSGRGIQTSSGTLLHTLVNLERGLRLFASEDHGETWSLIDTPVTPANESKVVELSDGSWMINSRVEGAGMRYVHISSDEGATWESRPAPELVDPGCNASIIRYPDGGGAGDQLLFSNAASADSRANMTVRVSADDGRTWSQGGVVYEGPSAYSSMTVLPNGDVGLFFEKDGYTENVFVRLTMDWLQSAP